MAEHEGGDRPGRTAFELKRLWDDQPRVCPLCRFVATAVEQYVDGLFYEMVNDPPTRDAIRAAGGFCRYHAALIAKQGDALGTAIILQDVLTQGLRAIEQGDFDHPAAALNPLARLWQKEPFGSQIRQEIQCPACPICDAERRYEELAVDGLLELCEDPAFSEVLGHSGGVCVPHFHLAFERSRDDSRWATLLAGETEALRDLIHQLAELARKHDYQHKDEPKGEEMRSWLRALNAVSSWTQEKGE